LQTYVEEIMKSEYN